MGRDGKMCSVGGVGVRGWGWSKGGGGLRRRGGGFFG